MKKFISLFIISAAMFSSAFADDCDTDISYNVNDFVVQKQDGLEGPGEVTINGLVQFQANHVESQYNPDEMHPRGASKIHFRRMGLLFHKSLYEDLLVTFGLDFNFETKKAEASKALVKKKFDGKHELIGGFDEKSFGYESTVSNMKAKRIEKSMVSGYFKNSVDSYMLSFNNDRKADFHYRAVAGRSENKCSAIRYYAHGLSWLKTDLAEGDFTYGAGLGIINLTNKNKFLGNVFAQWDKDLHSTIVSIMASKRSDEGATPFGAFTQYAYQFLEDQSVVISYSYLNSDSSKDVINPSKLVKYAPANKLSGKTPAFGQAHAIYVGHDWDWRKDIRFIWGYEFTMARTPGKDSSMSQNNLHSIRGRMQFSF